MLYIFFLILTHLSRFTILDGKDVKAAKKIISTSKQHAKHLFAGPITQQSIAEKVKDTDGQTAKSV